MSRLVLASSSPRRKFFVEQFGVDFIIDSPELDETVLAEETPRDLVLRLSLLKAQSVFQSHEDKVILAADTVVVSPSGDIFGKPKDKNDAFRMLCDLSDSSHRVISGVTVMDEVKVKNFYVCLLYTSPSPRDATLSRMPSSA